MIIQQLQVIQNVLNFKLDVLQVVKVVHQQHLNVHHFMELKVNVLHF